MALRNLISKVVLRDFERDLSRSVSAEVSSVSTMVDNMLAGQVFGYSKMSSSTESGAFQKTQMRASPATACGNDGVLTKIYMDVDKSGMFNDRESWHHVSKRTSM